MSVRKLEELSGIDKMAISKIERGMCPQVQLQTILKILDALDIEMTVMGKITNKKKNFTEAFNELVQGIHDGTIETIPLKSGKQSSRLSLSPELNIKWLTGNGTIDEDSVSRDNVRVLYRKYKTLAKLEAANVNEIRSMLGGNNTYAYAVAHYVLSLMEKK